ncbi:MAG TPA: hypothetical protein VF433_10620 [Cellvibrio sp.]
MLDQPENILHEKNELLVTRFLTSIFKHQITGQEKTALFSNTLMDTLSCQGFPEFNPQTSTELSGFLNYLLDVFRQPTISINTITADDTTVLIHFRIQGNHHEEFMGLTASCGKLLLTAHIRFTLRENKISEILMYNKHVSLTTNKGYTYELTNQQDPVLQNPMPQ